jgi:GT2 family glycosyltransferase
MDVSVIIVNWNSAAYVQQCLQTLYKHTSGIGFETIVVDSGSFDKCQSMLAVEYPQARFLQGRENLGFGGANNYGAEIAQGDYLLFLNPDTEVTDNAVADMLTAIKDLPRAGIVGCKLLNTDGSLQTTCIQSFPTIVNQALSSNALRRIFPRLSLWGIAPLYQTGTTPATVQAISGACMMIKKSVFEAVGGFSREYFMYTEDIDLCYKVQHDGYKNYYVGAVSIVHHGGGSSCQRKENSYANIQMQQSKSKFLRKAHGDFYVLLYRSSMFFSGVIRLCVTSLAFIPSLLLGQGSRGLATLKKWISIIRWSIGVERWTR